MNTRLLALDFGDRRIGLAAASMSTRSSSAIGTIMARSGVPDWLELDKAKMRGTFVSIPDRDEMNITVNEQLVVELISK